jgi:hypothetical protein
MLLFFDRNLLCELTYLRHLTKNFRGKSNIREKRYSKPISGLADCQNNLTPTVTYVYTLTGTRELCGSYDKLYSHVYYILNFRFI